MKVLVKFLLFSILVSFTCIQAQVLDHEIEIKEKTFYYNLNIVNHDNELEFHVDLKYKSDSIHKVLLPFDYYGTPELHKWVSSFEAKNGTAILEKGDSFRKVSPNEKGEVQLKYIIKYDSKVLDKYSYAPNVSESFFYIAGCQWLLPIYPLDKSATFNISMNSENPDWILYSSLSGQVSSIELVTSYEDLISAGFGGNRDSNSQINFELQGTKFSVFVNGTFNFNKEALFNDLEKILKAQKMFFTDREKSFYYITILPRTGLLAGASIPNLFYCFVDTNQSARNISELISHEYFHNWLPNKMYLPTLEGEYDFKHEWFHEGFTEYFSRKILYDQNLIPKEYYVELLNNDLINIINNPSANESYQEIAARDNFGAAQKKLNYYRGVLIALRWDHQLQEKGSNLKEMMLHLYNISRENNGGISYKDIYSYGNKYVLHFQEDIDRFIIKGETLRLEPGAIVNYQIKNQQIKLFYPGFDVNKSSKDKVVQGVDRNGLAYKAGLRDGMQYVKRKNSNRWSNSWSKDKPYVITVLDNGKEKNIGFFPHGNEVDVFLYKRN